MLHLCWVVATVVSFFLSCNARLHSIFCFSNIISFCVLYPLAWDIYDDCMGSKVCNPKIDSSVCEKRPKLCGNYEKLKSFWLKKKKIQFCCEILCLNQICLDQICVQ